MWSHWLESWKSHRSVWAQARKMRRSNRRLKPQIHWLPQQVEELEARSVLTQIMVTSLADVIANDGEVTLREAIKAANEDRSVDGSAAGNGADEIVFVESLIGDSATIDVIEGEIAITSDLSIRGPGSDQLRIASGGSSFVFQIGTWSERTFDWNHQPESLHVRMTGLTLTDGLSDGSRWRYAIHNYESLVMTDCVVSGMSGYALINYGSLKLNDCRVETSGTGIQNHGDLSLKNSVIEGNRDAGIVNYQTMSVVSCDVVNNVGDNGGGLQNWGQAKIQSSLFTGNHSTWVGGGIANYGEMDITDTTVTKNTAVANAGIRNEDGKLTIDHCTITANVADLRGGGIRNFHYDGGTGFVRMTNSVLAGNTLSDGTPAEVFGNSLDMEYSQNNLVGDPASSGGLVDGANDNIVGASGIDGERALLTVESVLFPALVRDDRGAQRILLAANSPISDRGTVVTPIDENLVAVSIAAPQVREDSNGELDFRFSRLNTSGPLTLAFSVSGTATIGEDAVASGMDSLVDGVGTVTFTDGEAIAVVRFDPTPDDEREPSESILVALLGGEGIQLSSATSAMGLIAFDETLVVNTLADESDANPWDQSLSLREAISLANRTLGSHTIEFAPSLTADGPATIQISDDRLTIDSEVSILGPGADLLTISNSWNAMYVPYWSTQLVSIEGLTLQANDPWGEAFLNEGIASLNSVTFKGQESGAVNQGTLTLNQCIVSGSRVGLVNNTRLDSSNCRPSVGTLVVQNSTISGNGLGIFNQGALFVQQSSIVGNGGRTDMWQEQGGIHSTSYFEEGSGLRWQRATVNIDDSDVSGNVNAEGLAADLFGNGLKRWVAQASSDDEDAIDDPEVVESETIEEENLQAGTGRADTEDEALNFANAENFAIESVDSNDDGSDEATPTETETAEPIEAALTELLDIGIGDELVAQGSAAQGLDNIE